MYSLSVGRSLVRSFVRRFVRSSLRRFVRSSLRSFVASFVRRFVASVCSSLSFVRFVRFVVIVVRSRRLLRCRRSSFVVRRCRSSLFAKLSSLLEPTRTQWITNHDDDTSLPSRQQPSSVCPEQATRIITNRWVAHIHRIRGRSTNCAGILLVLCQSGQFDPTLLILLLHKSPDRPVARALLQENFAALAVSSTASPTATAWVASCRNKLWRTTATPRQRKARRFQLQLKPPLLALKPPLLALKPPLLTLKPPPLALKPPLQAPTPLRAPTPFHAQTPLAAQSDPWRSLR